MTTVNGDAFTGEQNASTTAAPQTQSDNAQQHHGTPNGVVGSHHGKDSNHHSKSKEGKKEHSSKDKHREHKHKDHKHSKEHKSKENHVSSSKEHSSSKHHHHHHKDEKPPKEKTKEKSKDESSKDKHHEPSKSKHSSDKDKHKSKDEKHKSDKHKSSKDGTSSGEKTKDPLKLVIKPKDGSVVSPEKHSSSKHSSEKHSSSSDKHKVKHSSSSEKHSQERHASEKHSDKHSSDKHSSDKRSSDKHSSDKHSSEKHSSEKSLSEKHEKVKTEMAKGDSAHRDKEKDKDKDRVKEKHVKVEKEEKVKIKTEPVTSPLKVKTEPIDEESPPQRQMVGMKSPSKIDKSIKRESEESDDEPLAARMEKVKKKKSDTSTSKKRKTEDEDFEPVKKSKTVKKEKEKKTKRKTPDEPVQSPTKKSKKQEEEQEVWKWWEEEKKEDGVKWKTLSHNGPVFAPDYERLPKGVRFYYDGKQMDLSPETEEVAGFYGRMLDHDYVTKKSFNDNFFKDWKKVMTEEEKATIKDLSKCNFKEIDAYYKKKSEERKAMTKEEKLAIKKENEELQAKYGFCIIDGHKQKIGNFKIEPPGLFRGRGEHPKMGMLKRRVTSKDVIINIGKEATVPPPPPGLKWKEVRHDNTVTWLACWTENILGSNKYIMLNPSSKLKGEKDWQKYELARKLKSCAAGIRQQYQDDWKSKEMRVRQRAVALYFIDKLALRAGNEKEEGETADTVGCCSLRVEHITLDDEKMGKEWVVTFDFLGKDSIRYVNSVPVEKRVYKNLKLFMENKQPGDDLFDRLDTSILNKYLNDLMEGLTAKVFRTYNASKTLQEQLDKLTEAEMSIPEKMLAYNRANRAVAILCNHQRSVPKTFDKQMENLQAKIQEKEQQIKEHKKDMKAVKESRDKGLYEKKKKRLNQLEEQLRKLEVQATDKEENKQIALGTSKLNYLDPRISVAWCKKWNVPIEKIYNKTQRDKFRWAIEMATADYKF